MVSNHFLVEYRSGLKWTSVRRSKDRIKSSAAGVSTLQQHDHSCLPTTNSCLPTTKLRCITTRSQHHLPNMRLIYIPLQTLLARLGTSWLATTPGNIHLFIIMHITPIDARIWAGMRAVELQCRQFACSSSGGCWRSNSTAWRSKARAMPLVISMIYLAEGSLA